MKIASNLLMVILLTVSITFFSCGSGDDDSDTITVNTPRQEEQDPTGGSSGGGSGSCLTTNQRRNITTLLDKLTADSPMTGDTTATFYNSDGTTNTATFPATAFAFDKVNDSTWGVGYAVCTSPAPEDCRSASSKVEFRDGCLYIDDDKATISSSSTSNLGFSTRDSGTRTQGSLLLTSSGIFKYTETTSENGRRTLRINFTEHSGSLLGRDFLIESLKLIGNERTKIKDVLSLE